MYSIYLATPRLHLVRLASSLDMLSAPAVEVTSSRKRLVPIDEKKHDPAKRICKTNSVNGGMWGWDRVLRRVVKKCMGTELTSSGVNAAIRNMDYITTSGEPCRETVSKVLNYLVAEGLAEDTPGVKRRGPFVRTCRWRTWEEVQLLPATEHLLSRLRLVEGDFRCLPPSAPAAGA